MKTWETKKDRLLPVLFHAWRIFFSGSIINWRFWNYRW